MENSQKASTKHSFLIGIFLFLLFVFFGIVYVTNMEKFAGNQETRIFMSDEMVRGGRGSCRLIVLGHPGNRPVANAKVKIVMALEGSKTVTVFEGVTDRNGTIQADFKVPDDTAAEKAKLLVTATSSKGSDRLESSFIIKSANRLYLSSDKPIYKPGETMHIRLLALSNTSLKPVTGKFTIEAYDGKGNKVFKKTGDTSQYGIASADFTLAELVNVGNYALKASMGQDKAERTVEVKKYVLPKYKVALTTDRTFYKPSDVIRGTVCVRYFFGKPAAGAKIWVDLSTADVARARIAKIEGTADAHGTYSFSTKLPPYFAGTPLQKGKALLFIEATAIDKAQHKDSVSSTVTIARESLLVQAVPEAGALVPGVENTVYLLASYPDGSPARATLSVKAQGKDFSLKTGTSGFASFAFVPSGNDLIEVNARDSKGATVAATLKPDERPAGSPLIRTEKAIYRIGETLGIEVIAPSSDKTVYLDILKGKQLILTRSGEVSQGKAFFKIDTTPDMRGTLTINAYSFQSASLLRDTRKVIVRESSDLLVRVAAGKGTYRPGEDATIEMTVSDASGSPQAAALGISIVDESVFALQEASAGLEKVYFFLEEQLAKPRYELCEHFVSDLKENINAGRPLDDEKVKIAFAGADVGELYAVNVNTYQKKLEELRIKKQKIIDSLGTKAFKVIFLVLLLVPCLVLILTVVHTFRKMKNRELFVNAKTDPQAHGDVLAMALTPWVMLIIPVLAVFTMKILDDMLNMNIPYQVEQKLPLFIITAELLVFIAYFVFMIQALRHEGVMRLPALRLTIIAMMVYLGALFLLFLILMSNELFHTNFQPSFDAQNLFILDIIGVFSLLVLLVFTIGVYTGDPERKTSPFLRLVMVILLLVAFAAVAAFMVPNFLRARGGGGQRGGPVDMPASSVNESLGPAGGGGGLIDAGGSFRAQSLSSVEKSVLPSAAMADKEKGVSGGSGSAEPYLRQYFPETLYFNPQVITDEKGRAAIKVTMADSITSWRLSAFASSLNGLLGSADHPIRVFQDFFVDLDLPVALTQGDEASLPVAIYNYLGTAQAVSLRLESAGSVELLSEPAQIVEPKAGSVSVAHFRIRARSPGMAQITVTARGTKLSDAIRKTLEIVPSGKEVVKSDSGWLKDGAKCSISIPPSAVAGSEKMYVKVYPGVFSSVVEGLEKIFVMPHGCFEQTSSTVYPNLLALDYMKKTGKITPEIEVKARGCVSAGYQRLLTFEVPGGGFSLYGQPPASIWLSAYGLMEFSDMRAVNDVDEKVIERTTQWLSSQESPDGSYQNDLRVTSYVAMALLEAGNKGAPGLSRTIAYLKAAAKNTQDPYLIALIANALALSEPDCGELQELFSKLESMKKADGDAVCWSTNSPTLSYCSGNMASVETTALAARAMLLSKSHPEMVKGALTYLVKAKDPNGTWYTTQPTVQALRTLSLASMTPQGKGSGEVDVLVNGSRVSHLSISEEQSDVLRLVDLTKYAKPGENKVELVASGQLASMYQVVGSHFVPWKAGEKRNEPLSIKLSYDRTTLRATDTVKATVALRNNLPAVAPMIILDLGIPPGFLVNGEDLDVLVEKKLIDRYELAGRQIIIYLGNLNPGQTKQLSYTLVAKYPIKAQSPPSRAYEYYNPDVEGFSQPVPFNTQ
ncbi:MAG: MG2 domain-containing protein [Candidatus Eremiobacteraeota bacterium]|nr:MG2 domain-containing protein [Candidatus Eremiobacteraeota bacterium]